MIDATDEGSIAGESLEGRFDVEPVWTVPEAKSEPIIRTSQIVWGVFWGMWAFAVTPVIAWSGIIALLKWSGDIH
jgi:hypothetical protein